MISAKMQIAPQPQRPPVAVVILNWNGRRLLGEFLPSVVQHTPPNVGRVIVADNGSTDDSVAFLSESFPSVEVMAFDSNYGFAEGYNKAIGIIARDYPYAVLLNSDVAVKNDWLSPLLHFMQSNPHAGACQPKILSYANPGCFEYAGAAGGFIDRNGYPYCRGRIFSVVESDKGQYDGAPLPVFWASGAAMMVRTDAYLQAGGLDGFFFAHMEEIDLCWRMQLQGWRVYAVTDSAVYHLGGGSLPAGNPRKTYLNFRNNLLMLHKNLPGNVRRTTLLRRRLLDTIAFAKFLVTFDFQNARAVWKAHRDFAEMRSKYTGSFPVASDLLHTDPKRPNIITGFYLLHCRRFTDYA